MKDETEVDLARKLLDALHLSVPERKALPGGKMPFSACVAAVRNALSESSRFPDRLRDAPAYDGAVIEAEPDGRLLVHVQHECGVGRFGPVETLRTDSLEEAVRLYLRETAGTAIDGVAVDWER